MAGRYNTSLKTYGRRRARWQIVADQLVDTKQNLPVVQIGSRGWYKWLLEHTRFEIEIDEAVIIFFQDIYTWYDGPDRWYAHYAIRYPGYVPLESQHIARSWEVERCREKVRLSYYLPDELLPALSLEAITAYQLQLGLLRARYIQTETVRWYQSQFWQPQRGSQRDLSTLESQFASEGWEGHVYFAENAYTHPGLVKIGCSSSVHHRLQLLGLKELHLIETNDTYWAETKFHFYFFTQHQGNEWFALTREQMDWIRGFQHCDRSDAERRQAIRRTKEQRAILQMDAEEKDRNGQQSPLPSCL